MAIRQRSLALPHRALRASTVQRFHALVGLLAVTAVVVAAFLWHDHVWAWQISTWIEFTDRLGITATDAGLAFSWDQAFLMIDLGDAVILTVAVLGATYLVFRSNLNPTIKGLFVIITVPIYLYALVTFITGAPPVGALGHIGPEWLYGELVLWCLIPVLYALYIFPVPFSLPVKLASLLTLLAISIVWRTATPIVYIFVAVQSRALLAIPAWMALGPWADYLYIIPVFSATLVFYKGGKASDYHT